MVVVGTSRHGQHVWVWAILAGMVVGGAVGMGSVCGCGRSWEAISVFVLSCCRLKARVVLSPLATLLAVCLPCFLLLLRA